MVGNKCENSHHHHPLSLRYVIIPHACVRDSQSKCNQRGLEFRLPWPASLEDCLNEWCRYAGDHTPPRGRGQHSDAHLQPERLPVVLSHDYRLSFLRPQTEHQAVSTIPRMQRCLQQRTRAQTADGSKCFMCATENRWNSRITPRVFQSCLYMNGK